MSGNDGRNAYPGMTVTAGYTHERQLGHDIGLRLALEALTREVERQQFRAGVAARDGSARSKARHEYTAGVLTEIAEELAGRFRQ